MTLMEERIMEIPQGYRILVVNYVDRNPDLDQMRAELFAVDATMSFQLRWEEEFHREHDVTLANYDAGKDPIVFSWVDDIRAIKLPPNSKVWRGDDWFPCDAL